MTDPNSQPPPGRSIARRDLEGVIRRALELSASDADATDDVLAEGEVVRIAQELGLQPRHVRQALYELPSLPVEQHWADRYFGSPVIASARPVPGPSAAALRRLEEYLTTREYLQLMRRRSDQLAFVPADDTISSIARSLLRPSGRHHLARARRVLVSVHPLDDETSHVSIQADHDERRRAAVRNGLIGGGIGGVAVGTLAVVAVDALVGPMLGTVAAQVLAFGGTLAAGATAGVAAAASGFRRRMAEARVEVESLLDRLERGDRLEPPPAPWRRRLQSRWTGERH